MQACSIEREARDHGLISSLCKRSSALVNCIVRLRNILSTEKYLRKIAIEREISKVHKRNVQCYACERRHCTFELLMALNIEGALVEECETNNSHKSLFMAFCSFLKHSLKVRRRTSNYFWRKESMPLTRL